MAEYTARKKFNWTDPTTGKKYRDICTTPKIMRLLEEVIETDEQAEDFLKAFKKASDHPEHNIAYFIGLIKDTDIRQDAAELFGVTPNYNPRPMLKKEYSLSERIRNG